MKIKDCFFPILVFCYMLCTLQGNCQIAKDSTSSDRQNAFSENSLFDRDDILEITLLGDTRELLNDRYKEPKNYPFRLSYTQKDSMITIPVEARTRGNFRRIKENCIYPPILLQFPKDSAIKSSIFNKSAKLKLVMPCKGVQFVVYEWLVYRLYNVITPKSFRARLVKVKLVNNKNNKGPDPFYGILLEDEKQMAKRNGTVSIKKGMRPEQTDTSSFLKMAVFEYLIGNTDWSTQFLQNIKLISVNANSVPTAVPYDFDMSGIVNSPYARPADELKMYSVRERRYRGYCIQDLKKFDPVIEFYNKRKEDIYSIYNNCPLLDAKYLKSTIKFLDDFYATINNPAAFKKDFEYPCDKHGTGNVVIKGLRGN
jgi:hypothetical protein